MPKQIPRLCFDTEAGEAARFSTSIRPDAEVLGTVRCGAEDPGREGQVLTVSWMAGSGVSGPSCPGWSARACAERPLPRSVVPRRGGRRSRRRPRRA
ncbi:VOC family protein [Geodermatophilus sp. SYSU D01062]